MISWVYGLSHSISTTASDKSINTKATPASTLTTTQTMADLIVYIIPTVLGMLLIACFFAGFCFCYYYRKRNKTLDAEVPTTTEIQEFGTGKHLKNVHESEIAHLKAEANSESDVFDKTIIATPDDKQLIPIYALPNKGDRQVNGSDDGESISRGHLKAEQNLEAINSVQQAGDLSQSSDVMDVACDAHSDGNKTETKVKHAISSDDKETENAFTQMQARHDYAYVDRSSVKGVEISNNVIYSLPDEKKNKSLEMVPNEAYERFDEGEKESKRDNQVDDIPYSVPFEKEASEGSVMNEAYQSYDTDEDEGNKGSNATYYYLDKNDKEEMGEPTELFYEAV
ncbi:hypothetical protein HOLleu_25735 [Holothuria leucospilota]|uniref:Uncharacterized protein n=1 Tax=Holothuria leucospilota TaxID=206669 RepID=A0A9Q1BT90_HOLLE|nr:hypothetical protein HOLleu_25735 [Holothuria leucospilota]